MAESVVMDELHVTVRVPGDLPDDRAEVIRRILNGTAFMARLRRAVRTAVGAYPEMAVVRVSLTR